MMNERGTPSSPAMNATAASLKFYFLAEGGIPGEAMAISSMLPLNPNRRMRPLISSIPAREKLRTESRFTEEEASEIILAVNLS